MTTTTTTTTTDNDDNDATHQHQHDALEREPERRRRHGGARRRRVGREARCGNASEVDDGIDGVSGKHFIDGFSVREVAVYECAVFHIFFDPCG